MWIGGTSATYTSSIVQDGLIKADTSVTGCSGGTGGSVKTFYYWINTSGSTLDCIFGQIVSTGEKHVFKVQRCASTGTTWCTYIDDTQVGSAQNIGLSTVDYPWATGEYNCFCGTSSNTIDGVFGGTASPDTWAAASHCFGCTGNGWYAVSSSTRYDNSCNHGDGTKITTPNWTIDPVDQNASWSISNSLPITGCG